MGGGCSGGRLCDLGFQWWRNGFCHVFRSTTPPPPPPPPPPLIHHQKLKILMFVVATLFGGDCCVSGGGCCVSGVGSERWWGVGEGEWSIYLQSGARWCPRGAGGAPWCRWSIEVWFWFWGGGF
ncbi:hypothetical protein Hanom_Chr14g01289321 [Helianthus anomalus]